MTSVARAGLNVRANGIRQHVLRLRSPGLPPVVVQGSTSPAITWGFAAERPAEVLRHLFRRRARTRRLVDRPFLDYGLDAMAHNFSELIAALGLSDELCVQVPSLASIAKVEALIPKATLSASIATIYQMLKALNLEPSLPAPGSLLSAAY